MSHKKKLFVLSLLTISVFALNVALVEAIFTQTVIKERDMRRSEAVQWRKTTHAYARVCGREGTFSTVAKRCPKGVLLKEPYVPDCLCVRGVWVLHSKLCGNQPVILVGRIDPPSDCYTVEFEISMLLHLGDVDNPFKTKAYIAPQSMTVFHEVPHDGSWTPVLDFKNPILIVINPREMSYEADENNECFSTHEGSSSAHKHHQHGDEKVHIWATSLTPSRYRAVRNCTDPTQVAYDEIATYNYIYYHASSVIPLPVEGCIDPCNVWPDGKPYLMSAQYENNTELRPYTEWFDIFRKEERKGEVLKLETEGESTSDERPQGRSFRARKGRRRKRAIVNCETVWDGKGFCMKSYWDPVDKLEMSEKDKAICYPSDKEASRKKLRKFG